MASHNVALLPRPAGAPDFESISVSRRVQVPGGSKTGLREVVLVKKAPRSYEGAWFSISQNSGGGGVVSGGGAGGVIYPPPGAGQGCVWDILESCVGPLWQGFGRRNGSPLMLLMLAAGPLS